MSLNPVPGLPAICHSQNFLFFSNFLRVFHEALGIPEWTFEGVKNCLSCREMSETLRETLKKLLLACGFKAVSAGKSEAETDLRIRKNLHRIFAEPPIYGHADLYLIFGESPPSSVPFESLEPVDRLKSLTFLSLMALRSGGSQILGRIDSIITAEGWGSLRNEGNLIPCRRMLWMRNVFRRMFGISSWR